MRRILLVAATALAAAGLFASGQRTIYDSAVKQYETKQYEQSCGTFKQLYEASSKFVDLDASIVEAEKASLMRGFDWQNRAFLSQNSREWAKECAEWYRAAVRQRAAGNLILTKSDVEAAERTEKHLVEGRQTAAGKGSKSGQ